MPLVAISEETHRALQIAKVFEGRDMKDIVEEVLEPRLAPYFLVGPIEKTTETVVSATSQRSES